MKKLLLLLAALLFVTPAQPQSYPSPTFYNVTLVGGLFFNQCSGVVIGNGPVAATCAPVLPLVNLPIGYSGQTLPLLSNINTWSGKQTFADIAAANATATSVTVTSATISGSITASYCAGVMIGNGASPVYCAPTLGDANLPTGTSSHALPYLDGVNTWSGAQTFGVTTTTTANIGALNVSGHISGVAAATSLASCGTTPSLSTGANDNHGTITAGTGTPASCTVTFAAAYVDTPDCLVQSLANVAVSAITPSTTALTFTFTGTSSARFTYHCMGH